MRWIFRLLVYFVKPLLVWYICGYFGYKSIQAIAGAVARYEREIKKAEIQAGVGSSGDNVSGASRRGRINKASGSEVKKEVKE